MERKVGNEDELRDGKVFPWRQGEREKQRVSKDTNTQERTFNIRWTWRERGHDLANNRYSIWRSVTSFYDIDLTFDECGRAWVWSLAERLGGGTNSFEHEAWRRAKWMTSREPSVHKLIIHKRDSFFLAPLKVCTKPQYIPIQVSKFIVVTANNNGDNADSDIVKSHFLFNLCFLT